MKLIESLEDLKSWDVYQEFIKATLKQLGDEEPAFISKDKLDFEIKGSTWSGHVFLAGKKALASVQRFKKEGVAFREGLCTMKNKELHLSGFQAQKLVKEAGKTLLKLQLGYRLFDGEEALAGAADAGGAGETEAAIFKLAPERRKEILADLVRMQGDIDRLMAAHTECSRESSRRRVPASASGRNVHV